LWKLLQEARPTGHAPTDRYTAELVDDEMSPGLLANQVDFVAGKVIARCVIAPTISNHRDAKYIPTEVVEGTPHAARQRFEVCDREHDASVDCGHPCHFGDRKLGAIEMIHRTFANRCIEGTRCKRQVIRPTLNPAWRLDLLVFGKHARHADHTLRRFGPQRVGSTHRHRDSVLANTTGHIKDALARSRQCCVNCFERHALEQILTVPAHAGRDHVAHVSVAVDYSHSARP